MSVKVFVGRRQLEGYTSLDLSRSKDDLTGELNVNIFLGYTPNEPILQEINAGAEVLVYIGNTLAFVGAVDRRVDKGTTTPFSLDIGPNEYSVMFRCRGKTRDLIDSSHQHPTGTMLRPTNQEVVEALIAPWNIELDWQAEVLQMDKFRFRDGSRVIDELQRLADMSSLYFYETRTGSLRVIDKAGTEQGEAIVLGKNILSFSADQSSDHFRTQILVKGQRIEVGVWGDVAVLPTLGQIETTVTTSFKPQQVQLFGDATDEFLNRRGTYESNKRSSDARKVTVEVFNIQQSDGKPWDVGELHYVEIPPAGIFAVMEIVGVRYNVDNDRTLKTVIDLSPPPVAASKTRSEGLASVPEATDQKTTAEINKANSGVEKDLWQQEEVTFTPAYDYQYNQGWVLPYINSNQIEPPPETIPEDE